MTGKLESQSDGYYKFSTYFTNLKQAGCSFLCCCPSDSSSSYEINRLYIGKKTRDDIINILETENQACTNCLRISSFLLHFASYYMILYPIILIVGMIPFFGAVGITVLIFIAFLLSLITYLIIISTAWIFAKPFLSAMLFGVVIILIIASKITSVQLTEDLRDNKASRIAYRIMSVDSNFLEY